MNRHGKMKEKPFSPDVKESIGGAGRDEILCGSSRMKNEWIDKGSLGKQVAQLFLSINAPDAEDFGRVKLV